MLNNFNAAKVKDEIVQWIRDWFENNGKNCNAIVGISGGKDSSVVAGLCVEALGKDRVIGVLMPQGKQNDIECSDCLINHLGISSINVNIGYTVDKITTAINLGWRNKIFEKILPNYKNFDLSKQAEINLPARIRMTTLYAVSQSLNGRVANTCNLSEDYVGYATRYGDGAGDFSPLSNLTVKEVKAIGYELRLPKELIEKVPSDGLCGKTDEDNLGFTYEVLDKYIRTGVCDDVEVKNKIDTMHKKNKFKLELIPSFPYNP